VLNFGIRKRFAIRSSINELDLFTDRREIRFSLQFPVAMHRLSGLFAGWTVPGTEAAVIKSYSPTP
jgi:hypothetical protein